VFCLLVAGLVGLRGPILALSLPLFLYWAYSLIRAPDALNLRVERELDGQRVQPQQVVQVVVKIHNQGSSLQEVVIEDTVPRHLSLAAGSPVHFVSLPHDQRFEFTYSVRGPRGAYSFDATRIQAADHLGLLPAVQIVHTPAELEIRPALTVIRRIPIWPRRTRVYAGSIPARAGGAGVEFFGVRTYALGDSPRRVNWRASARYADTLFSNEFQQERVADVAVVLDGRERANLGSGGDSLFEHSVRAAGTLADTLLRQGNRVGLLIYSNYLHWTLPAYGKVQRERVIAALSRSSPGASQIFEGLQNLPARLFPPESQIVLVSPLMLDDVPTLVRLRARGYQVMVVSPDPVAYDLRRVDRSNSRLVDADLRLAARILRLERLWMLSQLRRAGVHVLEWDTAQPFDVWAHRVFGRRFRAGALL
jgi:uncharacterized protein (DUF58 family)